MKKNHLICLMGPTASGKTELAVEIVQRFPCEIISVDSAMVYRGMDIGTAKPGKEILDVAPHRLIDICDPSHAYSAGEFCRDVVQAIDDILAKGKIPLLVGGTMLYFRVLQQGIAELPKADAAIRTDIKQRAEKEGWPALHAYLKTLDQKAASRINPNDSQRIQRALEVILLTGNKISVTQQETTPLSQFNLINIALMPQERKLLHERIAIRFELMLQLGLIDEVKKLYQRGDLSPELPSIRSVGYRQVWAYLQNEISYEEMRDKAIIATRQLAKRQMTWLRSWPNLNTYPAEEKNIFAKIMHHFKD